MVAAMRTVAFILVGLGALFVGLAVVYGYFFGGFRDIVFTIGDPTTTHGGKNGETMLYAFLGFALPLLACPLALLDRSSARG
jgi:hypothetical protein